MKVLSGSSFLNQKGQGKADSKPSQEKSSFDDVLLQARSKKKPAIKKAKPLAKKAKPQNNDMVEAETQPQKQNQTPKKMEGQRSQAKARVAQVSDQPGQKKPMMDGGVEEGVGGKKIFSTEMSKGSNPLSSQLSGSMEKTLETPQKMDLGTEMAVKPEVAEKVAPKMEALDLEKLNSGLDKLAATTVNANKASKAPVMKMPQLAVGKNKGIDVSAKMKPMETLETLDMGALAPTATVNAKDSAELGQGMGDQEMGMESMIQQALDSQQSQNNQSVDETGFAAEMAEAQQSQSAEKIENMDSIVKSARAVVDDGGGSMEIHLQPEGLGKIQLKVAVQDGQVNVEMLTDNQVAKRALEESLADIKTALEGQKLLVETMKVEMGQDYQKDFSDLANHTQEQQNRDFAEQFLGQFRQEREERLGGMFDAFRNFQRTGPEPELTMNRQNPYHAAGKGRTINLVA